VGSASPEKKKKKEKKDVIRHNLKDLFVSLPLLEEFQIRDSK
jgi:hypothetical protein